MREDGLRGLNSALGVRLLRMAQFPSDLLEIGRSFFWRAGLNP